MNDDDDDHDGRRMLKLISEGTKDLCMGGFVFIVVLVCNEWTNSYWHRFMDVHCL